MLARLFFLFITVPLVELFCFLIVGQRIGIASTFAMILLTGLLGAVLARSQGVRTYFKYREAIVQGKIPHEAILDGVLILIAGVLLLVPGFLTDALGFFLLIPLTRRLVRGKLEASLMRRFQQAGFAPEAATASGAGRRSSTPSIEVITVEAEVVESIADRKEDR